MWGFSKGDKRQLEFVGTAKRHNQVDEACQELLFILSRLIALVLYYMAIMMTHGANAIKQTICYKWKLTQEKLPQFFMVI